SVHRLLTTSGLCLGCSHSNCFSAYSEFERVMRRTISVRRPRLSQVTVLLACLSLTAYFAHHAVHGRHGLEARSLLIDRSTLLEFEIRGLEAVRSELARDVALLNQVPP